MSALFDDELDLREETVGDWRQLGLDLEFVRHSSHTMLADGQASGAGHEGSDLDLDRDGDVGAAGDTQRDER